MSNVFDLRAVLEERNYPEATKDIYLDAETGRELAELDRKINDTEEYGEELDKLEAEYAEKVKKFKESKYTFYLRGISQRAMEDIQRKALSEFPVKRDQYQNLDTVRELDRKIFLRKLIFQAYVWKIQAPDGAVQTENLDETMVSFAENAPSDAIDALDEAIGLVAQETNTQRFAEQDVDFLSKP